MKLKIDFNSPSPRIQSALYGHFSEHIGGVFYDGLWVGPDSPVPNIHGFRKELVERLRAIHPPVLRWPGGCFAETYDWRDGIGPREKRPTRVNWWYRCDGRTESNQVGTHEFVELCRLIGAEPYFAANMTSLTPQQIRDWVEYCNFPGGTTLSDERARNGSPEPFGIRYWGIGNENWGDGGKMTPEDCAHLFNRYACVLSSACKEQPELFICGANGGDTDWTRRLLRAWRDNPYPCAGMSVHYYCGAAGEATNFTDDQWYELLAKAYHMGPLLDSHFAVMDELGVDYNLPLVVDEWGCWHPNGSGPSKGYNLFEQQSTMRDALVAAITLHAFQERCERIKMANVAQLCNNLHCLFLAGGDKMCVTPTYHVFDMMKGHMGGNRLTASLEAPVLEQANLDPLPLVSVSASEKDGVITLSMANLSLEETHTISLSAVGRELKGNARLALLQAETPQTVNTFDRPDAVAPVVRDLVLTGDDVLTLPPASLTVLTVG